MTSWLRGHLWLGHRHVIIKRAPTRPCTLGRCRWSAGPQPKHARSPSMLAALAPPPPRRAHLHHDVQPSALHQRRRVADTHAVLKLPLLRLCNANPRGRARRLISIRAAGARDAAAQAWAHRAAAAAAASATAIGQLPVDQLALLASSSTCSCACRLLDGLSREGAGALWDPLGTCWVGCPACDKV